MAYVYIFVDVKKNPLQSVIIIRIMVLMLRSEEISALIERCGGPDAIVQASADAGNKVTDRSTVYKWSRIGVPEKHWGLLIELSGATPNQLHAMNERVRRKRSFRACALDEGECASA